jgi:hypothetical protein
MLPPVRNAGGASFSDADVSHALGVVVEPLLPLLTLAELEAFTTEVIDADFVESRGERIEPRRLAVTFPLLRRLVRPSLGWGRRRVAAVA